MTIEVTQTHPIGAGYDSVQINPAQDQYAAKTSSFNINRQTDSVMQVHKLSSSGNNITCNDGSQIGYYKRLNNHSKSWIIYLQGGGFCNSPASCQQRWQRTPHLMSSKFWPPTKLGKFPARASDSHGLLSLSQFYRVRVPVAPLWLWRLMEAFRRQTGWRRFAWT